MRNISFSLLVIFLFSYSFGSITYSEVKLKNKTQVKNQDKLFQDFWKSFKKAMIENDSAAVIKMTDFPFYEFSYYQAYNENDMPDIIFGV